MEGTVDRAQGCMSSEGCVTMIPGWTLENVEARVGFEPLGGIDTG
jgi:hypothetical protein